EEDIKNISQFKLERERQQLCNTKTIHERNQNRARQYELEKKELIGFDFSQHQIIPEDIIAVFNRANTIRIRDKGYDQLEYYHNKKNKKSKLNTQFMAQIILNDLVVKGLVQQELLLQKTRTNISYLTLSTKIVGLGEEAKSQAALQEWPYW
ncbi:5723_t:CDS:2, partial [Cetraspora pellucida]